MQQYGIVRRIDELGRVVIPKELRRNLRLQSGDPVEIFAEDKELILKKFSPINNQNVIAVKISESLAEITNKICVLTTTDNVIFISDLSLNEFIELPISSELNRLIYARDVKVLSRQIDGRIIPIIRGEDFGIENQIIYPIVSSNDVLGCVILFDRDKKSKFSEDDRSILSFVSSLLEKSF